MTEPGGFVHSRGNAALLPCRVPGILGNFPEWLPAPTDNLPQDFLAVRRALLDHEEVQAMSIRASFTTFMAAAGLVVPLTGPAHATGSIGCNDMKFDSSLEILLGAGPVTNVISVSLSVGDRDLTTIPGQPGEPAVIAQAFDDGELFRIDLVDDQATRLLAEIRLLRADHEEMPLQIGYVRLGDEPPVGISCVGP